MSLLIEGRSLHLILDQLIFCYFKGAEADDAIIACSDALSTDPNDVNVLCDRADAHLNNDNYEDGKILVIIIDQLFNIFDQLFRIFNKH